MIKNTKRKWQFEYWDFYINRIFKTCYWKGEYKNSNTWKCRGLSNGKYDLKGYYELKGVKKDD